MSDEYEKSTATKDVILFTGQSGIEVGQCLKKVKENEHSSTTRVLKLEKVMIGRYKEMYPDKAIYHDRKIVIEILSLPPFRQRQLWNNSFALVKKELRAQSSVKSYFLCLHACFYHQKNREFLSPIDLLQLKGLSKIVKVKMVIVLVDDCYDIYKRLLAEGKMFSEDIMAKEVRPQKAMIRSVWNLLTILSWREIEIAFSRKVAEMLRVPFFIVPVKHHVPMIQRLVSESLEALKIFYLAHPITSVRKRIYARTAKFPEKLNAFAEKCLSEQENTILFIPDTIDELRIKRENGLYLPELDEPWPLPFEESNWLFCPLPSEVQGYNPLNPRNHLMGKNKKHAISYAIEILAKKIDEQITSRDYGLIEQSKDGVIIYKPYWEGDISGGALKEAEYNRELRRIKIKEKERTTFVLEEAENLGKYRILELFKELVSVALRNVDKEIKERMENLGESWKGDSSIVSRFYKGEYPIAKMRCKIEEQLPGNYDFDERFIHSRVPSLHGTRSHEKDQRLDKGWKALHRSVMSLDPFGNQCFDPSKEYFITSSDVFDAKLGEFLKDICSRVGKQPKRRKE